MLNNSSVFSTIIEDFEDFLAHCDFFLKILYDDNTKGRARQNWLLSWDIEFIFYVFPQKTVLADDNLARCEFQTDLFQKLQFWTQSFISFKE